MKYVLNLYVSELDAKIINGAVGTFKRLKY